MLTLMPIKAYWSLCATFLAKKIHLDSSNKIRKRVAMRQVHQEVKARKTHLFSLSAQKFYAVNSLMYTFFLRDLAIETSELAVAFCNNDFCNVISFHSVSKVVSKELSSVY